MVGLVQLKFKYQILLGKVHFWKKLAWSEICEIFLPFYLRLLESLVWFDTQFHSYLWQVYGRAGTRSPPVKVKMLPVAM